MREVLLNAELIAVNQDPNPRPAMGIVQVSTAACGRAANCELWHRAPGTDKSDYVILFNPNANTTAPTGFSVRFADVGIAAGASVAVRDVWAHKDLGVYTGSYTTAADIVPHEARTLRLTVQ